MGQTNDKAKHLCHHLGSGGPQEGLLHIMYILLYKDFIKCHHTPSELGMYAK